MKHGFNVLLVQFSFNCNIFLEEWENLDSMKPWLNLCTLFSFLIPLSTETLIQCTQFNCKYYHLIEWNLDSMYSFPTTRFLLHWSIETLSQWKCTFSVFFISILTILYLDSMKHTRSNCFYTITLPNKDFVEGMKRSY